MLKVAVGETRASENLVKGLVEIGALYIADDGAHANSPGVYRVTSAKETEGK